MIRYKLRCELGHPFESWFQSSAAYESQERRKLVSCPVCGSSKVERAVMAPQIVSKTGRDSTALVPAAEAAPAPAPASTSLVLAQERELRVKLKELRDHIVKKRRQCRRAFRQRSPQDALRRYRASTDLRRGLAG